MDDTPEVIRQQMDETKLQLAEKLESLEHQVTQTVQSTGTAVNATVASVQETVETVTGAIQDAVKSVSNALDVQRQFDRHPWLILGGSVVLGYLAAEFFSAPTAASDPPPGTAAPPLPLRDHAGHGNWQPAGESSPLQQLRSAAVGSLIGIVQDVASRASPLVLEYLAGNRIKTPISQANPSENSGIPPSGNGIRQRLDSV